MIETVDAVKAYHRSRSCRALGEGRYFDIFEVKSSSLGETEIYGNGVFWIAKENIQIGHCFLAYLGNTVVSTEVDPDNTYIFDDSEFDICIDGDPDQDTRDGYCRPSIASYINDGKHHEVCRQNCEYEIWKIPENDRKKFSNYKGEYLVLIVATRRIESGEELLVSYEDKYWENHFDNKILKMAGWGAACKFNRKIYIGTIVFYDDEEGWTIVWSDGDSGFTMNTSESIDRSGVLRHKRLYETFLELHEKGAGKYYPSHTKVLNPLVGKRFQIKKDKKDKKYKNG